tara:strand:+ start:3427 stop:4227 length:801 start_codon:yes stop_codon:yes gene_type:complete
MNQEKLDNLKKAADWITDQHIRRKNYCSVPERYGVETLEDAYTVQERLIEDWEQKFGPVVGYKLALTSKPIQELVGLDHPCIGRLYRSQIFHGNQTIQLSSFGHLGIEFELAVRIGADMPKSSKVWTSENVKDFVKAVSASFELIDDRNADYSNLEVNSLVSDNSWFGGAVLGKENESWKHLEFDKAVVKKIVNDQIETSITGAALGDPFNSVAWIANFLNKRGRQLKANELIMTGSTFATMFPKNGDTVSYEVNGIGTVELKISE